MKLNEINSAEDPLVVTIIRDMLDAGKKVVIDLGSSYAKHLGLIKSITDFGRGEYAIAYTDLKGLKGLFVVKGFRLDSHFDLEDRGDGQFALVNADVRPIVKVRADKS